MTTAEEIAAVQRGERVSNEFVLHVVERPELCRSFRHKWRTITCDGDTDVIECSICGRQELCGCDFDDEYA